MLLRVLEDAELLERQPCIDLARLAHLMPASEKIIRLERPQILDSGGSQLAGELEAAVEHTMKRAQKTKFIRSEPLQPAEAVKTIEDLFQVRRLVNFDLP